MKSFEKWFFAKFFFLKHFIISCCLLFFSKAPVLHKILWEVLLKPLLQTQGLKERGKQKKMKMKKAVLILPKWGLISQWLAGTKSLVPSCWSLPLVHCFETWVHKPLTVSAQSSTCPGVPITAVHGSKNSHLDFIFLDKNQCTTS